MSDHDTLDVDLGLPEPRSQVVVAAQMAIRSHAQRGGSAPRVGAAVLGGSNNHLQRDILRQTEARTEPLRLVIVRQEHHLRIAVSISTFK